ncbi:phage protease [Paludibacterium denitrificans]|uniref:phage protease n=1 Tax=Paludibacterium denitrificans TaxID=2675226 RepID=UPI001E460F18|nr:phage protease [Paludibacterium denitrificans]
MEWTEFGIEAVKERGFQYLSAEYSENYQDNEQGRTHGPVLLGAGLTVRPVIKRLDPVTLSCDSGADTPVLIHPELARTLLSEAQANMNKYLQALLARLKAKQLSQQVLDTVKQLGEAALASCTTDADAEALCTQLEEQTVTLSEALAALVPLR